MTEVLPVVTRARYHSAPPRVLTWGDEVADLGTQAGFAPDPEQRLALDDIFGEDEHGLPSSFEDATVAPRQNIKTGLFKLCILGWLFLTNEKRIIYSAHEAEPALSEMLNDLRDIVDANSWLSRRVRQFYEGNGQQRVDMMDGRKLLLKPRTKSGGRALAGDKVILDEGLYVTGTQLGTLVPVMSTRPSAQLVWGSSPPLATSAALHSVMGRGRAGTSKALSYREFASRPPAEVCEQGTKCDHRRGTTGCGCDDPQNWWDANSAYEIRIPERYVRNERQTIPETEFTRERMGWGDDPPDDADDENRPFSLNAWQDLVDADPAHAPEFVAGYSIEQDLDRAWTSITGAAKREDGRIHVEVDEHHQDLDDDQVVQLAVGLNRDLGPATFAIDMGGPAKSLAVKLHEAGLMVEEMHTAEVLAAYSGMVQKVKAGVIVHGPQAELDNAVEGAKKRTIGEGGNGFGRRKSTAVITPIVAAANAVWLVAELDYDVLDSGY